jgi:hypothetical protein
MTILTAKNTPRVTYTASGGQTAFTIPFEFFSTNDIKVYNGTSLLTYNASPSSASQYSITGTASSSDSAYEFGAGGTITLGGSGATASDIITIIRDISIERTSDFPLTGSFDISSLNTDLDKIYAKLSDIKQQSDRSVKLLDTDSIAATVTLPAKATRASKVLTFDSDGDVQTSIAATDVTTIAGIASDVTTVSGIASNVTSVAGNASNINAAVSNASNINSVAGNETNINAAVSNATNINTVAGANSNITTVASNIASVNTVATDITKVVAVANDLAETVSEVETVANDLNESTSEIEVVAGAITNVNNVGGSISNVNTVAGGLSNINTVAGIQANVTTVAGISSDVSSVASQSSEIAALSGLSSSDISTVAGVSTEVATVAGISSNVTTVAGNTTNINAVAGQIVFSEDLGDLGALTTGTGNNINTVATSIANVNTVAGISSNVSTVAGISSNVTTVAGVASNVTTVASNISGVNSFADRYRVGSSDPTSSLDEGDLAYNTSDNALKYYNGSSWASITAGLTDIVGDTTPQLGGALDGQNNNMNNIGTIDGTNLQIDFGGIT